MKYKILNEKEMCTLIINKPDQDDSSKYTCEANGVPTTGFLIVEGENIINFNNISVIDNVVSILEPPVKYEFTKLLNPTTDLTRTREGILECKVNHSRAPVTWYRNGKEIQVD